MFAEKSLLNAMAYHRMFLTGAYGRLLAANITSEDDIPDIWNIYLFHTFVIPHA